MIILACLALGVYLEKPVFLGDAFRVAVLTIWSELYYLDNFTCIAGMDLSRFQARSLPLVWMSVFAFLDYPASMSINTTSLHYQLFGYLIGKVYGYLAWKNDWISNDWKERRYGNLHEFIPPAEMFIYLVIALLRGGSFM